MFSFICLTGAFHAVNCSRIDDRISPPLSATHYVITDFRRRVKSFFFRTVTSQITRYNYRSLHYETKIEKSDAKFYVRIFLLKCVKEIKYLTVDMTMAKLSK